MILTYESIAQTDRPCVAPGADNDNQRARSMIAGLRTRSSHTRSLPCLHQTLPRSISRLQRLEGVERGSKWAPW